MDKIAFICENSFIYWTPVIIAISGLAAALIFVSIYTGRGGKYTAAFVSIPISAILGLVIGRFVHWYCNSGAYSSFAVAMTDYSRGEFALVGVFISCGITACLLRLVRLTDNLPKMLDAMSIAGCIGISVGRLASLFDSSSRGKVTLPEDVGFPFAYPMINPVSHESENRLATFMIQCGAAAVIAIALITFMAVQRARKKKIRDGDITLLFLGAYCICQIVCDSTRYDRLVFRSNGFVSMVQIVGLVVLLAITVIFSVRLIKAKGFSYWYIAFWAGILGMLGLAGYMEYFVQNNSTKAGFAYSMMFAALLILYAILLTMRYFANPKKVKNLRAHI